MTRQKTTFALALDCRTVWRWHFYAGLLTLPFVIILAVSGAIYLFKDQIEAWSDRAYDRLEYSGDSASVADQVGAALAALPGSIPVGYELPTGTNAAARVIVSQSQVSIRVYVHPGTLQILHMIPENDRLMRTLFRLHGELLMGDRGSNLVELAASWTIILIITGLYLWWPRHAKGLGGVLYPRLRSGSAPFWRDLHSVTGVWISTLALCLLVTGLPWANCWGNYFKTLRHITGTAVAQLDWTTGSERLVAATGAPGHAGEHSGHGGREGGDSGPWRRDSGMPKDMTGFDRVVAAVLPLKLEPPVVIAPPPSNSENWSAKSMTPNRPHRVSLLINGTTGEIVSRKDFKNGHLLDRIVGTGIAAHEGRLFGWPNQLLGLLTALGLVMLSVSGAVMWWRRREQGVLGAPKILLNQGVSFGLVVLVVAFGIYLPLFGASLLIVLLAEKFFLSRIPRVRHWLGLPLPRAHSRSGAVCLPPKK
jgi:uncharacterized iron-regulated membrane protein